MQRTSLGVKQVIARAWDGPVALDPRKRLPFKCVIRIVPRALATSLLLCKSDFPSSLQAG